MSPRRHGSYWRTWTRSPSRLRPAADGALRRAQRQSPALRRHRALAADALARAISACSGGRWAGSPGTGLCRNCALNPLSGCGTRSGCSCAAIIGRRYLGWVDPCFNADPRVPGQLAELLLRDGIRLGQSAWVRTDAMVRDARSGALASCVRSGLNEVYLGIERPDGESLSSLHKTSGAGDAREALRILRGQFPEVLAIGSFIYGLPGDSPQTIRAIHRFVSELELDQFFFIPLTPLPGTPYWKAEDWDAEGGRCVTYDFLPRSDGDAHAARLTWALHLCFALGWPAARIRWLFRGLFASDPRRRRMIRRHAIRGLRLCLAGIAQGLLKKGPAGSMRYPRWYED